MLSLSDPDAGRDQIRRTACAVTFLKGLAALRCLDRTRADRGTVTPDPPAVRTVSPVRSIDLSSRGTSWGSFDQARTAGFNTSSHHCRKPVGVVFSGVRRSALSRPRFLADIMSVMPRERLGCAARDEASLERLEGNLLETH